MLAAVALAIGAIAILALGRRTSPEQPGVPPGPTAALVGEPPQGEPESSPGEEQRTPEARPEGLLVVRVIDGDTIEVETGERVRYIGVDAPETLHPSRPVECFGREAAARNEELVAGKRVRIERDVTERDAYGRLLRYVTVGDVFVNEALIRGGFAHAVTYPPDVKYLDRLRAAEREARENKAGLWSGACAGVAAAATAAPTTGPASAALPSSAAEGCPIKGNISAKGEKIYHLPGCGSYGKTRIDPARGEQVFCSETEAVAAGWRKARNCP